MNPLHFWGWTILHSLWESTAIALLFWIALAFTRSSQARYLAAVMALVGCVVIPIFTTSISNQNGTTAPTLVSSQQIVHVQPSASQPKTPPIGTSRTTDQDLWVLNAEASPKPSVQVESMFPLLLRLWLAGMLLMCCRLVGGLVVLRNFGRRAVECTEPEIVDLVRSIASRLGLNRRYDVKVSTQIGSPMVIGLLKAVVILPSATLTRIAPEHLEALLAHELAHIKRFDTLSNLIVAAIETVLFFHPAVWWLSHVVRTEREHCCDDLAIQLVGSKATYARALVTLEELRVSTPMFALAANDGSLIRRIRRLLAAPQETASAPWIVGAVLATLSLTVACAERTQPQVQRKHQPAQTTSVVHIHGKVLNASDHPVAGATIFAESFVPGLGKNRTQTTQTLADGTYLLSHNSNEYLYLVAFKPGVGFGFTHQNRGQTNGFVIRLSPPAPLHVVVTDQRGRPLPGVKVGPETIVDGGAGLSFPEVTTALSSLTNKQGVAVLKELPTGYSAKINVQDPSFALESSSRPFASIGRDREVHLVLGSGCEVDGTVTLGGKPVAKATVISNSGTITDPRPVETDDQGKFKITGISVGQQTLQTWVPRYLQDDWCVAPVTVVVSPKKPTQVELKLSPGGLVHARVRNSDGSLAIHPNLNFVNQKLPHDMATAAPLMRLPDGTFQQRLPAGNYTARIYSPGQPADHSSTKIIVEEGHTTELDMSAPEPVKVEAVVCKVYDANGKPVPELFVQDRWKTAKGGGIFSGEITDRQGEAIFRLPSKDVPNLTFEARLGNQASGPPVAPINGRAVLHLHPFAISTLTGRIVDSYGGPISGAKVYLGIKGGPRPIGDLDLMGAWERTTDANGRYTIPGLADGAVVTIMAQATNHADSQTGSVKVGLSKVTKMPDLTLHPARTISGKVVNQLGKPVQGAEVFVFPSSRVKSFIEKTDAQGHFSYGGVDVTKGRQTVDIHKGNAHTRVKELDKNNGSYVLNVN